MHDYHMLDRGDRVMVAVSGGVDSMVLAWLMHEWRKKIPFSYQLYFVHIDHGFGIDENNENNDVDQLLKLLATKGIDLRVIEGRSIDAETTCFICSRNRRNQLFDLAKEMDCNKIAFGHHKDDLIETLFLNMFYGGNISTMLPNQALFDNTLNLIRPMAYIEKHEVMTIASGLGLQPIRNSCPLADQTQRDKIRDMLQTIYDREPEIKKSIFSSLTNVKSEYML